MRIENEFSDRSVCQPHKHGSAKGFQCDVNSESNSYVENIDDTNPLRVLELSSVNANLGEVKKSS